MGKTNTKTISENPRPIQIVIAKGYQKLFLVSDIKNGVKPTIVEIIVITTGIIFLLKAFM